MTGKKDWTRATAQITESWLAAQVRRGTRKKKYTARISKQHHELTSQQKQRSIHNSDRKQADKGHQTR
jgi:hypothetical protein